MIRWGAQRPAVVWALATGIVVSGAVAFTKLPLATRGTVEFPKLVLSGSMPGASPELVETYLTSPLEGVVQGVRGVRGTESISSENSSSITVTLDPKTDVTLARLAILERLETLKDDLPRGADVSVSNYVPEDLQQLPLLEATIVGPYTPGTLTRTAVDLIQPRLATVPGVASVNLRGGATVEMTVAYDPIQLRQLAIDPGSLQQALSSAKQVQALGQIRQGSFSLSVVANDQPRAIEDIARLPIVASGGRTFALGDLASIRPEEDAHGSFYRIDGQTAVSVSLTRQPGADAIRTAALARAALAELRSELPPGDYIRISGDESDDLRKELSNLLLRCTIAFVSVFLVLLITLRSFPAAALVIGSAAIAIAGASLSLYLMHIPANMLTLAGLGMGIGILVQNGLVVVERLRAAKNTPEGRADAGRRIAPAVLGATLTTTVVLLPFLYLQGNARALFAPFAGAFALALFWSVGTALVFVPAVGRGEEGRPHGWPALARLYSRMVGGTLRWRFATMVFYGAAVALLSWAYVTKVPRSSWGRDFGAPHTVIRASVSFPRGSDPAQVEDIISQLEERAIGQPGVALVRSDGSPQGGSVAVEFTAAGTASDAPWLMYDRLMERAVVLGGTEHVSVSPPPGGQGFYNSSGGGGGGSMQIKLLGYSYEGVLQLALDLKGRLEQFPRVHDVNVNAGSRFGGQRALSVSLVPDRIALGRVGATAQDYGASVQRQMRNAANATDLQLGGDVVRVQLRAAGAQLRDMTQLSEGIVFNPTGAPIRIGDVSSVGTVEGLAEIRRENQQYLRTLTYEFRGPQKLADRTHKSFMQSITVPAGYTVTDERYYGSGDDPSKGLVMVFGLGIVLVLLAVALVFDSVWAAAMVLLALPIALGGVVAAFWITKTAFNREAAVGVILVVGLAVNHSILLIDAALEARRRNGNRLTLDDVHRAATDRVTMIVLVTLTTLASLTPMAWGTKSDQMFGAIALATAGGTIAGTLGVMFLLPPMLLGFRRIRAQSAEASLTVPAES